MSRSSTGVAGSMSSEASLDSCRPLGSSWTPYTTPLPPTLPAAVRRAIGVIVIEVACQTGCGGIVNV
jgi:hypothetical protein